MTTFSEIVDATDALSIDEQQTLLDILQRRLAERNRARLVQDVQNGREEFAAGQAHLASVDDIINEVGG